MSLFDSLKFTSYFKMRPVYFTQARVIRPMLFRFRFIYSKIHIHQNLQLPQMESYLFKLNKKFINRIVIAILNIKCVPFEHAIRFRV